MKNDYRKKTLSVISSMSESSLVKKTDGITDGQCTVKKIYPLEYTNRIISSVIGNGICSNFIPTI